MSLSTTVQVSEGDSVAQRGVLGVRTIERLRSRLASNLIPLPFLGYGLMRGWMSIFCDTSFGAGPSAGTSLDAFDLAIVAFHIIVILLSSRLTPLRSKRWLQNLAVATLVTSSLLWHVPLAGHGMPAVVAWLQTALAGFGCTVLPLLWFELYATLSPVRICLYYASSLLVGAGVGWLYQGFRPEWLSVAAALLPLASLRCLRNCYAREDATSTRGLQWARFSFPWMPVLVITGFAFSYGMLRLSSSPAVQQETSIGTVAGCVLIVALVVFARGKVGFGAAYGKVLPLATAASLTLAAAVEGSNPWLSNLLANGGF